jgi:hypothetical protein
VDTKRKPGLPCELERSPAEWIGVRPLAVVMPPTEEQDATNGAQRIPNCEELPGRLPDRSAECGGLIDNHRDR